MVQGAKKKFQGARAPCPPISRAYIEVCGVRSTNITISFILSVEVDFLRNCQLRVCPNGQGNYRMC